MFLLNLMEITFGVEQMLTGVCLYLESIQLEFKAAYILHQQILIMELLTFRLTNQF